MIGQALPELGGNRFLESGYLARRRLPVAAASASMTLISAYAAFCRVSRLRSRDVEAETLAQRLVDAWDGRRRLCVNLHHRDGPVCDEVTTTLAHGPVPRRPRAESPATLPRERPRSGVPLVADRVQAAILRQTRRTPGG